MRKYWIYYRLKLQDMAAYRGQLLLWLIGNVVGLVVIISLVLSTNNIGGGSMTRSDLIVYYLGGVFLLWLANWYPFSNVAKDIKDGEIVGKSLLKPVSYFWSRLFADAAWHSVGVFIGLIAVSIVTIPLLSQIHLALKVQDLLLSSVAVVFSISIIFTMSMLLGLLAFWFTHVNVIDSIFWAVRMILAGQIVPLSFIPKNLQTIIILLPFRYMVSFPLDIFLGKLSSQDILTGYLVALTWTVILGILYTITWDRGVKAYTSFGS